MVEEKMGELELPTPEADVVDRVRYLIRLSRRNQNQFSKLAGLDPTILSKILTGKLKPSEAFINRIVINLGVSKPWLQKGEGVPYQRPEHAKTLSSPYEASGRTNSSGTPVYDIDVTAGSRELDRMLTNERLIGRVSLPGLEPDWVIVTATGDSMFPKIKNGSRIAIRPINLSAPISWGQMYVVVLDDYRFVKYVRRHRDKNLIILHSANPDYDDIEIKRSDVRALYLVEVIFNYEVVG